MATFFELPDSLQLLILQKIPTRNLYEILRGKMSPSQVLLSMGIPFEEIAPENGKNTPKQISEINERTKKNRDYFYTLAHNEFFDRHRPDDLPSQCQLLQAWLFQLQAKKTLPFVTLERLETLLSHPQSAYEIKLISSQLIHQMLKSTDTITPQIIETLIKNIDDKVLPSEHEITAFGSQFTEDQKNALINTLHVGPVCEPTATILAALIPFLSKDDQKNKLLDGFLLNLNTRSAEAIEVIAAGVMALYPSCSDKVKADLFNTLFLHLKEGNEWLRSGTLVLLRSLYPALANQADKKKIFDTLMTANQSSISSKPLKALALIYPSVTELVEKKQVFEALLGQLRLPFGYNRQTAAEMLAVLYPSLTDNEQRSEAFESLLRAYNTLVLEENEGYLRSKIMESLWSLYPSLKNSTDKARLFKIILNNLNDTSAVIQVHAVKALWTLYPNADEKAEVFAALLHAWCHQENHHKVLEALGAALAAIYPTLSKPADKTALFNALFDRVYNEQPGSSDLLFPGQGTHFHYAARALGTLAPSLSQDEEKINLFNTFFDKWDQLHIDYRGGLTEGLGGLYFALTKEEDKKKVFNALIGQLDRKRYPTDLVESAATALTPLIPSLSNNDEKVSLFKAYLKASSAWWYKDACKKVIAPLALLYRSLANNPEKIELFDAFLQTMDKDNLPIRQSVATTLITLLPSLSGAELQKIIALPAKPTMEALSLQLIANAHSQIRQLKQKPVSLPLILSPPPSSSSSSTKPEASSSSSSSHKKGKKKHHKK
jgi:hypothetical protein